MSLMHNPFEGRDEVIFITYDEIIKSPYPFILDKINTNYKDIYKDFIKTEMFDGLDIKQLLGFCSKRTDKDLFKYLAKMDFDYKGAMDDLKYRYIDMYENSELLKIGESIFMMLTQTFTKKIYIYTEEYDVRVHLDIQKTYDDMNKVNYISGDFSEAIKKVEGVTNYIISDLDYLIDILDAGKADYTTILLASYGYNYIFNEDKGDIELRINPDDFIKDTICKFSTFIPHDYDIEHFRGLE